MLLTAWEAAYPGGTAATVTQALERIAAAPDEAASLALARAFVAIDDKPPEASRSRALGMKIARFVGRLSGGRAFRFDGKSGGAKRYAVIWSASALALPAPSTSNAAQAAEVH
jgi:hypothetical protein